MPLEMLKELGGRLTYIELKTENDLTLCRYGEKGEYMFILFKGKVDVISSDGKLLKVFGSNEHVGRGALETDAPRNTTLRINFESHKLKFQKWDFYNVLIIYSKLKDQSGRSLLKQYIFLIVFNKYLYKVRDQVDNFYIVKNGTLVMNVVVDLEESNRWPFGAKEWERKPSLLVKEFL